MPAILALREEGAPFLEIARLSPKFWNIWIEQNKQAFGESAIPGELLLVVGSTEGKNRGKGEEEMKKRKTEPLMDDLGQYSKEVRHWQTKVFPLARRFADYFVARGHNRFEVSGLWQSFGEWEISRAACNDTFKVLKRRERRRK